MALIRFKDGQIVETDRITGLHKWEKFDTGEFFVTVCTMDGSLNFRCESEMAQDDMALSISKQLDKFMNVVDLVDIDFTKNQNLQNIN